MSWLQKKSVLVPIDFSEDSFTAVDIALDFAEEPTGIHIIHVTHPWSEHEIGGTWGQETEEERLESIKRTMQSKLSDTRYANATIVVRIGSPPVEIARYAEEASAELIIMPSHGRTGLQHFALGSVAERVIRMAHCPVLVLKKSDQKKHQGKKIIDYD